MAADLCQSQRDIYVDPFRAGNAGLAHAPRDDGGVRCLAAAAGQDSLGGEKAVNILGPCLLPNQYDLLAGIAQLFGKIGIEHAFAGRSTRGRRQSVCNGFVTAVRIERRVQQLLQYLRFDSQQRLFLADQALIEHVDRGFNPGRRIHLAVACLQTIERALFYRELVVLHFSIVSFELVTKFDELRILLRHLVLHLRERLRRSNTRDNILTLGIRQVFAEHLVFTRPGIPRESHSGRAVVAHVPEHHRANIDGSTVGHVGRDIEFAAIINGTFAHPGTKYGFDGELQLVHHVLRKLFARFLPNHEQELLADLAEMLRLQADIRFDTYAFLHVLEVFVEFLVVDTECDLAEKLDEAPIGVIGKSLVTSLLDQARERLVVEPQVQYGVHHPRHR